MQQVAAPVSAGDRIAQLDVLRGIAILGILMVNAPAFAMPFEVMGDPELSPLPFEPADRRVWWVMTTFFEGKFISLFSLLFGVSLYLVGGERDDPVREPVLVRRLLWLAVFGLTHGALIWFGDILLHYAVIGFLMFLFRSWSARKLLVAGTIWFAASGLMFLAFHGLMELAPAEAMERQMVVGVERALVDFRADLGSVQAANAADWVGAAVAGLVFQGPRTLSLMMLGLGLYKAGVFSGRARPAVYLGFVGAGLAALAVIGTAAAGRTAGESGFGWAGLPNSLLAPVVTLGYVGAVLLALKSGAGRAFGRVLAPVGRMAFTNYLTQSLIMTAIFYGGGRGLGLYGRLDWADWVWIVLAVWALQLVWSPLWLSRFTMGPFEWIWRRLSYGRPIPLRRRGALEGAAVAAG